MSCEQKCHTTSGAGHLIVHVRPFGDFFSLHDGNQQYFQIVADNDMDQRPLPTQG